MSVPIAYQANAMAVELFAPDQFVTPYDWTHSRDGNVNPVLHARFSTADGEFDAYAKPFNWNDPTQATQMLNEVTGWLLARSCGLPCSERAFFIQLPLAELPAYKGPVPLPLPDTHGYLVCFVTQEIKNTAIRGMFETEALLKEQIHWPHCNSTIAFDEAIANTDRHLFNLLRRGPADFALIDHGYLLRDDPITYPAHWINNALEMMTHQSFKNLLHHNAFLASSRTAPTASLPACSQGLRFGGKMRQALQRNLFEIAFWCSKLLPGSSARWLKFLRVRTQDSSFSDLLHQRYGLIPFHVQPTI